ERKVLGPGGITAGRIGPGKFRAGHRVGDGGGELPPPGEIGRKIPDVSILMKNLLQVRFVADGETVEQRLVMVPDIFGDVRVDVTGVQRVVGFEQAEGIDDVLDAGGLHKGEEVVDLRVAWNGRFGWRFDGGSSDA